MVTVMASRNRISKSDIYNSHTRDDNKMLKVLQGHPVKLNTAVRQVSGYQSSVSKLGNLKQSQGFHLVPSFCSREVYEHEGGGGGGGDGARCPSFANNNANIKPFLSNSRVYEVRESKGDKRQELTKLIYVNQKLKSSEMIPTPRRKYEHSKYQKNVNHAQSSIMPETMIVGSNSSDSSKNWIVYRDYSSLNAHSSKYGGKRNVWTEENGGRTVENSVAERISQNHPDGRSGLSNELEIMKPQYKENSSGDTFREDNVVDENKDLQMIEDLASNETTNFNNKTNSELGSPIVPASNSTGKNMATVTSQLQETRSQIYKNYPSTFCVPFSPSRSWGVCGASMRVHKTECNNTSLKQRNTLVNNDSSILVNNDNNVFVNNESGIPSPRKELIKTAGRTSKNIACRMCREKFHLLSEVQALPLLDIANNVEKNKIETESSHNIGQLNTNIENLLISPRSDNKISHTGNIAMDLLDYLRSYQGIGRQVLGLKTGEKSICYGTELQKYSLLKKVDKLPPLRQYKSQVETSKAGTDSQEISAGANRIHLVVKLPQAEDEEE